jgi:hypothetical protein
MQQKQPEQHGDANRNKEQRSNIQRCQRRAETAPHGLIAPDRASVLLLTTLSICHRFDKKHSFCERFCAKRGKYDAQEGKISCAKEQKTRQSRGHFPPNHRRKKTAPEFDPGRPAI